MTESEMIFYREWPLLSLQSLSTYINISQIVQMRLHSYFFHNRKQNIFYQYNQNIWMNIDIFMKQAHNLSSLIILGSGDRRSLNRTIENIISIIPHYIKHLQMPINGVDQIKSLLERCQHLSTLQLDVQYNKKINEVIKWFADNTINSTCSKHYREILVWLGREQVQSTEISVVQKRIKLSDNSSNS
jgi:hypothetical protein